MPDAPPKPERETWRDWLPDEAPEPDLFTRDEIIEMAARRQVAGTAPITAGDLRYWESIGILPHGTRQWRNDAARALYPSWYAGLARQVRLLQRMGYSLNEMRPRIRAHHRLVLGYGTDELDKEIVTTAGQVQSPEDVALWPDLVGELERLARWRAHLTGTPTERVEVRVIGVDGAGTIYPLPISSTDGDIETAS